MSKPTTHPGCRIKSVTHKTSGFKVVRLTQGHERTRASVLAETRACLDSMETGAQPIVGMALVLWTADGTSDAVVKAYPGSNIPSIALPDFVRNRLLAAKIEEWSRG